MIHCVAKVINEHSDYRYACDDDKIMGIWDILHPMYTLPRKDAPHLFTMAVTEYREDFDDFYRTFIDDYAKAEICGNLFYNTSGYKNVMGITAMPNLHFSSFSFGAEVKPDFTPFTVIGKYENLQEGVIMPVCGEFAHSVNDGYHITKYFQKLEENMKELVIYLNS